jgi:hypothetical protein
MRDEDKQFLATLVAIREPTGAMVYDATNAGLCTPDKARAVWRAMIDRLMGDVLAGHDQSGDG